MHRRMYANGGSTSHHRGSLDFLDAPCIAPLGRPTKQRAWVDGMLAYWYSAPFAVCPPFLHGVVALQLHRKRAKESVTGLASNRDR
eukprot:scaffold85837_cov63-Attheya_sp.AAC.1